MTRKRFIRLLMAEGNQRNRANEIAWTTQKSGVPYADAYFCMHQPCIVSFNMNSEAFRRAADAAAEALRRIFVQVAEQLRAKSEYAGGRKQHEDPGD